MVKFKKPVKKGKMRIQMTRGCVCDALTIDGKDEYELTDEERQKILDCVYKNLKPEHLNEVLQKLIELFGEYVSDDEPCECCGDYVEQYTWDLEK